MVTEVLGGGFEGEALGEQLFEGVFAGAVDEVGPGLPFVLQLPLHRTHAHAECVGEIGDAHAARGLCR